MGPNYLSPNKKDSVKSFMYLLGFQLDFAGGLNKHAH